MKLLCLIGIHAWHPTARVTDGHRLSKLICTRCGTRKWWRVMTGPTRSALSAVLMLLFLSVVFVVWVEVL